MKISYNHKVAKSQTVNSNTNTQTPAKVSEKEHLAASQSRKPSQTFKSASDNQASNTWLPNKSTNKTITICASTSNKRNKSKQISPILIWFNKTEKDWRTISLNSMSSLNNLINRSNNFSRFNRLNRLRFRSRRACRRLRNPERMGRKELSMTRKKEVPVKIMIFCWNKKSTMKSS